MREPSSDICPLMAIANINSSSTIPVCLHSRCAWWDFGGNECVIVTAATALGAAAASMEDMRQNPKRL